MFVKHLAWSLPAGVILTLGAWLLSLEQRVDRQKRQVETFLSYFSSSWGHGLISENFLGRRMFELYA